jgi:hypothetical protein
MNPAAYLDADAARLGDAEPLRTVPVPLRTVTDTVLTELDYTADLLQRADKAVQEAVSRLEGAGVRLVGSASLNAAIGLSQLCALVRIEAMRARAGRTA